MAVHVLGNSISMKDLQAFVTKHNLMLIEDTCESLGSTYTADDGKKKMLGTLGDFGCYSFYFSHHITSGEGGAVVCKTEQDYNFVRCLRAHGWTRHLTNRTEVEAAHPSIDSRFLFINLGYNLRPMEVQGAMLLVQMVKLQAFNDLRRSNFDRIRTALQKNLKYSSVMTLMKASKGMDPAWFGVAHLLSEEYGHQLEDYLAYLSKNGVENRPIISGNFIRQPSIAMYCKDEKPENYPGSEAIHARGFFIGVHQIYVEDEKIEKLAKIMLDYPFKAGDHQPALKKQKNS